MPPRRTCTLLLGLALLGAATACPREQAHDGGSWPEGLTDVGAPDALQGPPEFDATPGDESADGPPTGATLQLRLLPGTGPLGARVPEMDIAPVADSTASAAPSAIALDLPAGTLRPELYDSAGGQSWGLAAPPGGCSQAIEKADGQGQPLAAGGQGEWFNPVPARVALTITWSPQGAPVLHLARLDEPQGAPRAVGKAVDASLWALVQGEDVREAWGALASALRDAGMGQGADPLDTPRGRLFVAWSEGGAPEIRGSFTQWQPSAAGQMHRVCAGLYASYVPVQGWQAYKIVQEEGQRWQTDRTNPHIAWDGIEVAGTGAFNSVLHPQARPQGQGQLVWLPDVPSPELGDQRDVYVYLPPTWDRPGEAGRRLPVLLVHDGNESLVRSQLDRVADANMTANPDQEAILVFVALSAQERRMDDYTMGTPTARGDAYARFLAQTLLPHIDARWPTRTARGARGLFGASLGGLISYWSAALYPQTFGFAAGMSSSFWWQDDLMVREVRARGCQDVRYYLDSGSPGDNTEGTRLMARALQDLGCHHTHFEQPGATHDWHFWGERFPRVLASFAQSHTPGP